MACDREVEDVPPSRPGAHPMRSGTIPGDRRRRDETWDLLLDVALVAALVLVLT